MLSYGLCRRMTDEGPVKKREFVFSQVLLYTCAWRHMGNAGTQQRQMDMQVCPPGFLLAGIKVEEMFDRNVEISAKVGDFCGLL